MNRQANAHHSQRVRTLAPLRDFLHTESAGAVLLAGGALLALIWANSPLSASYESLWNSRIALTIAGNSIDLDLRHWVNDGLMTIFFFVVGLEIKREATDGHLSERRAALLPGFAAVGGMLVPALIYLAIAGSSAPRGWAIPVATDIALAIGVISVVGKRVPASLRAFLLGLAIVDDIGAIIIIAAVYSTGVSFGWLLVSIIGVSASVVARRLGVQSVLLYVVVGISIWLGLYQGGVHPTLAGVVMGLLTPAVALKQTDFVDIEEFPESSASVDPSSLGNKARDSVSVVEWLQHVLHPWSSFLIVPIFALANSGIHLSLDGLGDAAGSAITWGVFFGLILGKPLGVVLATRIAVRSGMSDRPEGSTTRQIVGVGMAAGIGFTVAMFITELALTDPIQQENAKLAILLASVVAAGLSMLLLKGGGAQSVGRATKEESETVG
ncbi:MAG: Na+/H+ antiporter NhaA [Ilumatobacteraceae bacterium]|jgi:Na+:H+ antiporter, NhaA family|nr:Na+/H+ antiporter NhaA [Ilumatobacteraceae bacterium]